VHGYNIGLERACRDAAVLSRRTGSDGRVLLFSWPASRTIVTYHKDARRLAGSMAQILEVLDELGRRQGRGNVNIVAHSMGSRIVLEAIESLEVADDKFGDLVLIAPDIDRDLFVEVLPDLKRIVADITVLVSDKDRLLLLSQTVNLGARLGQSDGVEIEGVDVIDVTEAGDAGFGGHVYHLTNENVGRVLGGILDGKAASPAAIDGTP
jgi:esterase/lipase superfamily enzyme